jgi:hypothetical protein
VVDQRVRKKEGKKSRMHYNRKTEGRSIQIKARIKDKENTTSEFVMSQYRVKMNKQSNLFTIEIRIKLLIYSKIDKSILVLSDDSMSQSNESIITAWTTLVNGYKAYCDRPKR